MYNNEKKLPILNLISETECCGCEACTISCPTKVLKMEINFEGFYYPKRDINKKCIHCNKCIKVCPLIHLQKRKKIDLYYAGFSKNDQVVLDSSSGGIFSEMIYALSNKFQDTIYFAGVVWNSSFTGTKYYIGKTEDDLSKIRKSKYIQARKKSIYMEIKNLLKSGEKVVFTGCPCEVAALYNILGKEYDNLYTIDLVCQGPTSPIAMQQYVKRIEKKKHSRIKTLNMRYVNSKEWIPQWINIHFENGAKILKPFYETDLGRCVHIMQRKSCYSCHFTDSNHVADVTLGDYHGATEEDMSYNSKGTSIVIANTTKGKWMLEHLIDSNGVLLIKANKEHVKSHNPRIYTTWKESPLRKGFIENFEKYGLHFAAKKTWSSREKILHILPYEYRVLKKEIKKYIKGN